MRKNSNLCPCGTGKQYQACCGRYIDDQEIPPTAEALMRSRYTAYTQANIPYIQQTMRGPAAEGFDSLTAEAWAKTAKWRRLKVLRAFSDSAQNDVAYVSFTAYYIWQGKPQSLHETSEFRWIDGHWYYTCAISRT
jgi:SEC-C motif domain protein